MANLKNVDWTNVILIVGANFQNADLTGGMNLPERINTKLNGLQNVEQVM